MATKVRLKLAPPWVTYVNELNAMFSQDPQVRVIYDNENICVKLYVEDDEKADAIYQILPDHKEFGNVLLNIAVIPANKRTELGKLANSTYKEIFDKAFAGNPVYSFSVSIDSVFTNVLTYIVFKNEVVQFFNDNLNDIYGNITTLYQEIAADLFSDIKQGVLFCTDVKKDLTAERQWP